MMQNPGFGLGSQLKLTVGVLGEFLNGLTDAISGLYAMNIPADFSGMVGPAYPFLEAIEDDEAKRLGAIHYLVLLGTAGATSKFYHPDDDTTLVANFWLNEQGEIWPDGGMCLTDTCISNTMKFVNREKAAKVQAVILVRHLLFFCSPVCLCLCFSDFFAVADIELK